MPGSASNLTLSLSCSAISHLAAIEYISGEEAISAPYSFDVCFSTTSALTISSLINQAVTISINAGSETLTVAGIIYSVYCGDALGNGNSSYRATVRPKLSLLGLNKRNQVFGTASAYVITDLIKDLLAGTLDKQSTITTSGQPVITCDTSGIHASYPSLNFIVQYGESDLNFLSRRCEDAGIFYFFEQPTDNSSSEKVIFGDANSAFTLCKFGDGSSTIDYSNGQQLDLATSDIISSLCEVSKVLPASLYLNDYDYAAATASLLTNVETVASSGVGNVVEYGDNYTGSGQNLAQVRAQAIAAQGTVFRGVSNAPQMRPGYLFKVNGHPNVDSSTTLVVTKVKHSAGTPVGAGQSSGASPQAYQNEFEAVVAPSTGHYRPQRVTPRPYMGGLVNAFVESTNTSNTRADIDASGGYKLRLKYDSSNSGAGKGSNSVRKAGPYAGKSDSGFDFPLVLGTEVVLGFINGDPDRPIIVGSAPNSATPDVAKTSNQTRNRIKTTSGAYIEIEDGSAPSGSDPAANFVRMSAPGSAPSYLRVGVQADNDAASPGDQSASWGTNLTPMNTPVPAAATASQYGDFETQSTKTAYGSDNQFNRGQYNQGVDQFKQGSGADDVSEDAGVQGVYNQTPTAAADGVATDYTTGVLIGTKQNLITNVGQAALTLIGRGSTTQVSSDDWTVNVKQGAVTMTGHSGIVMTSGNSSTPTNVEITAYGYVRTTSKGTSYYWSHSDSVTQIEGNKYQTIIGQNISFTKGLNQSTVVDRDESYKYGGRLSINLGAGISIFVAVDMKMFIGGDISFGLFNLKMVTGADMKFVLGMDFKMVTQDTKIVTVSKYEIANVANKAAAMNVKWYGLIYKDAAVEAKNNQIKNDVATLKNQMSSVTSLLTDMYAVE